MTQMQGMIDPTLPRDELAYQARTKVLEAAEQYNGMRHVLAVPKGPTPDEHAAKVRRVAINTASLHVVALAAPATDGTARNWAGGWNLRLNP